MLHKKKLKLFLLLVLTLLLAGCQYNWAVKISTQEITPDQIKDVLKGYPVIYNAEVNYYDTTGDVTTIDEINSFFNLPCGSDTSMITGQNYQTYDMAAISCVTLQEIYVHALTNYLANQGIAPTANLLSKSASYLKQSMSSLGIKNISAISPELRTLMIQWYADDTALDAQIALKLQSESVDQLFQTFKNALETTCFAYFQVPDQTTALNAQLRIHSLKQFYQEASSFGGATKLGCGSVLSNSNSQVDSLAGFAYNTPVGHTLELNAGQNFLVIMVLSRKPLKLTQTVRNFLQNQLLEGTQSPLLGTYARIVIQNAILSAPIEINSQYGKLVNIQGAPYLCAPPIPPASFYQINQPIRNSEDQKLLGNIFSCAIYYN